MSTIHMLICPLRILDVVITLEVCINYLRKVLPCDVRTSSYSICIRCYNSSDLPLLGIFQYYWLNVAVCIIESLPSSYITAQHHLGHHRFSYDLSISTSLWWGLRCLHNPTIFNKVITQKQLKDITSAR